MTGRRRSQPWLTRKLKITLDQRIGLRYAMPAMTPAQTADYITHHLKLAPDGPTPCSATTP